VTTTTLKPEEFHHTYGWRPQPGWARIAYILSGLTGALPRPHFVANPAGGLACYDPSSRGVFLNGDVLEGDDRKGGPLEMYPRILWAFVHEVGHHVYSQQSSRLEPGDHPRWAEGYTLLQEARADQLGYEDLIRSVGSYIPAEYSVYDSGIKGGPRDLMDRFLLEVTVGDAVKDLKEVENIPSLLSIAALRLADDAPLALSLQDQIDEDMWLEIVSIMRHARDHLQKNQVKDWCDWADRLIGSLPPEAVVDARKVFARYAIEEQAVTAKYIQVAEDGWLERTIDAIERYQTGIEYGRGKQIDDIYPDSTTRVLRMRLRDRLLHLNNPDIRRTEGWEAAPPGRLSGARALQRAAIATVDPFAAREIEIFKRVDRRPDPMVPLNCAIIIDQSGSMTEWAVEASKFAWALSQAVTDIDGTVRVSGMSDQGYPITVHADRIESYESDGSIENFYSAWKEVNPNGEFERLPGLRVLVIASDMDIVVDLQADYVIASMRAFKRTGGIVIVAGLDSDDIIAGLDQSGIKGDVVDVVTTFAELPDELTRLYEQQRVAAR
jgi:hypothetical protein